MTPEAECRELNKSGIRQEEVSDILEGWSVRNEMRGIGVWYFSGWVSHYWQDIRCLYVISGDSYVPSLFYDTKRGKFFYGDQEKIMHLCGQNLRSR